MKPKHLDTAWSARIGCHKDNIDEKNIWETRDKTDKHELDIVNYPCYSKNGEKDISLFELLNASVFSGGNGFS